MAKHRELLVWLIPLGGLLGGLLALGIVVLAIHLGLVAEEHSTRATMTTALVVFPLMVGGATAGFVVASRSCNSSRGNRG